MLNDVSKTGRTSKILSSSMRAPPRLANQMPRSTQGSPDRKKRLQPMSAQKSSHDTIDFYLSTRVNQLEHYEQPQRIEKSTKFGETLRSSLFAPSNAKTLMIWLGTIQFCIRNPSAFLCHHLFIKYWLR